MCWSRTLFPLVLFIVIMAGNSNAEWKIFYSSKSENTLYYYNTEKQKNSGELIELWIKVGEGYPGKITMDCKRSTYRSLDNEVKDIAPGTMMESLEKSVCDSNSKKDK